jgi:hypothetical protein
LAPSIIVDTPPFLPTLLISGDRELRERAVAEHHPAFSDEDAEQPVGVADVCDQPVAEKSVDSAFE